MHEDSNLFVIKTKKKNTLMRLLAKVIVQKPDYSH